MKTGNKIIFTINQRIKALGLSIKDISNYTDIDFFVLKSILKGKRPLKAPTLISLCYLLQIDFYYLTGDCFND